MKEYVFYGKESGELYRSKSLLKIYEISKVIKENDRKEHFQDTYYYEIEIENGDKDEKGRIMIYTREVKIYKRKNKIYCKGI